MRDLSVKTDRSRKAHATVKMHQRFPSKGVWLINYSMDLTPQKNFEQTGSSTRPTQPCVARVWSRYYTRQPSSPKKTLHSDESGF